VMGILPGKRVVAETEKGHEGSLCKASKQIRRLNAQEKISATFPLGDMPEQLPPFNLPAALGRANGKPELLRKMLLSFREQYKRAPSELRQRIAEGKTEEASRLAHSLKGVKRRWRQTNLHPRPRKSNTLSIKVWSTH
jgi:hypothetical protein